MQHSPSRGGLFSTTLQIKGALFLCPQALCVGAGSVVPRHLSVAGCRHGPGRKVGPANGGVAPTRRRHAQSTQRGTPLLSCHVRAVALRRRGEQGPHQHLLGHGPKLGPAKIDTGAGRREGDAHPQIGARAHGRPAPEGWRGAPSTTRVPRVRPRGATTCAVPARSRLRPAAEQQRHGQSESGRAWRRAAARTRHATCNGHWSVWEGARDAGFPRWGEGGRQWPEGDVTPDAGMRELNWDCDGVRSPRI